ncbi:MAG: hypothetical protein ACLFVJ_02160 [Persicimonas sp.]
MRRRTALVAAAILLASGCTVEDGAPWGYIRADLSVPSPEVSPAFEVASYAIEISTVRLIQTQTASSGGGTFDPQNPPPGCNLCHNGHCHCDGELVDYADLQARMDAGGGSSQRVLANLDYPESIITPDSVELGEVSVDEQLTIDVVEVELAAVRVDGTLTRDGEQIPMTLSLPRIAGTKLSTSSAVKNGADAPELQSLSLKVVWKDDWLAEVDLDELQQSADGTILVASTSNRDSASPIVKIVEASSLQLEVSAR